MIFSTGEEHFQDSETVPLLLSNSTASLLQRTYADLPDSDCLKRGCSRSGTNRLEGRAPGRFGSATFNLMRNAVGRTRFVRIQRRWGVVSIATIIKRRLVSAV